MNKMIILVSMTLLLSACNTFEGVGKDVESAGQWTADTAYKTKEKINGR